MAERIARLLLRFRAVVLLLIAAATVFFGFHAASVEVGSRTIDLFPSDHPYVETFKEYSGVFGGANRVVIQLEVSEGTIFERETLLKIRRITKALELLPGVNNYQVFSIAQRKVKELKVDSERGFRAVPVMWPEVPETPEAIADLRHRVHVNRRVHGTLVSLDDRATLIVAGFFEKDLQPALIHQRVQEIVQSERDERTSLQVIGRPILLGTIMSQYSQLAWLFGLTLVSILLVLLLYFRDLRGVLVPLCTALVSAVWGIGFLGLMGHNFDPLVIVVPFIISARALSHSVQMVARFTQEYTAAGDRTQAAVATFRGLARPGVLAIVTDASGVLLVLLTPIPLLQKLGLMGGFWVLSIVISGMVLSPLILSLLPAPRAGGRPLAAFLDPALARIAGWCLGPARWTILAVAAVVFAGALFLARDVVIGDVHPGTPMLWPDAEYNRDTDRIAARFRNTEELTVVVEGETRDAIKRPEVLRTIEAFQRHMEGIDEVGATSSVADLLPGIIAILHGSDPKWELIPDDKRESGFFLEMIYSSSEPGDLTRFVTIDSQNANISINMRDHRGETLRRVVARAQEFIDAHPVDGVRFRLAGGYGGLLAAINEEVMKHQTQVTLLAFGIILFFCALAYRSLWAGVFFLVPLALSNWLTYGLMGVRGIGLDVNALPVVAVGVGLGVDYGLYVVGRIQEELIRSGELETAIRVALATAGKAVIFTASTMVAGVAFWSVSFLRFQADMGTLLLFWMVTSMLGGLFLLPTLVTLLRPRFLFRGSAAR